MSTLIRDEQDIHVECDTDYGKYVTNGINYIPCTIKASELDSIMNLLMDYVSKDNILSQLHLELVGSNELRINTPITIMNNNKTLGEVLNELIYLIIGMRYCIKHRR